MQLAPGWSNCTWTWTIGWLTNCIKIAISAARKVHVRHYVCFGVVGVEWNGVEWAEMDAPSLANQQNNCGATLAGDLRERPFSRRVLYSALCIAVLLYLYVCLLCSCSDKSHDDFNALSCSLWACELVSSRVGESVSVVPPAWTRVLELGLGAQSNLFLYCFTNLQCNCGLKLGLGQQGSWAEQHGHNNHAAVVVACCIWGDHLGGQMMLARLLVLVSDSDSDPQTWMQPLATTFEVAGPPDSSVSMLDGGCWCWMLDAGSMLQVHGPWCVVRMRPAAPQGMRCTKCKMSAVAAQSHGGASGTLTAQARGTFRRPNWNFLCFLWEISSQHINCRRRKRERGSWPPRSSQSVLSQHWVPIFDYTSQKVTFLKKNKIIKESTDIIRADMLLLALNFPEYET